MMAQETTDCTRVYFDQHGGKGRYQNSTMHTILHSGQKWTQHRNFQKSLVYDNDSISHTYFHEKYQESRLAPTLDYAPFFLAFRLFFSYIVESMMGISTIAAYLRSDIIQYT